MNVTCPNCSTLYRVDPAKVPAAGVRARCAVCSAVFAVRQGDSASEPPAVQSAAATPGIQPPPPAAPPPPALPPAPASASPLTPPPAPPGPPPAPAPLLSTPPMQPAPSRPPAVAARVLMPPPAVSRGGARPATPRPGGSVPSPVPPAPPPAASVAPPVPPAPPAPPTPSAPPPAVQSPRPVNPFLSQDPASKARRLARALISDMVVYHPGKRQEGLRDGTLKQLFEEEIRKSWEEYSEQVGKDVADSTPYFRDALNEILADGQQLF